MLTGAVSEQFTSDLKEELLLTRWYELAIHGSSDQDHKSLPILLRHVDKDSGSIATSLLVIPHINSGSAAQQMYDIREAFSLD